MLINVPFYTQVPLPKPDSHNYSFVKFVREIKKEIEITENLKRLKKRSHHLFEIFQIDYYTVNGKKK